MKTEFLAGIFLAVGLTANAEVLSVSKNAAWAKATTMFNGMIAPLTGYDIRGLLWYQGEADIPHVQDCPDGIRADDAPVLERPGAAVLLRPAGTIQLR